MVTEFKSGACIAILFMAKPVYYYIGPLFILADCHSVHTTCRLIVRRTLNFVLVLILKSGFSL